eukprot:GHVU01204591.1.p3 GENE.GHVU01204591.1~~GHVU01204591.1.p3  ORF type:complete len:101 (+),score=12.10 GHVU01204591.1:256-558(+)
MNRRQVDEEEEGEAGRQMLSVAYVCPTRRARLVAYGGATAIEGRPTASGGVQDGCPASALSRPSSLAYTQLAVHATFKPMYIRTYIHPSIHIHTHPYDRR